MKINKIFSVLLPVIFISTTFAALPNKCGTIEALEAFRQGVKFARTSSQTTISSTYFVIHFDTTGTHAVTRAYAESVKKYAEYSWAKEIDTMKFAAPPPDGGSGGNNPNSLYDIYIRNLGSGVLGVTYGEASYSSPYPDGVTSYIQIGKDVTSYGGWGELQVTVAHEFNHACQFRYSWLEDNFWYENTSTWIEDMVYDNVNDYVNYLISSQSTPNPLDSTYLPINNGTNLYWYAGAIWAMFLQEYYADSCPRKCWEKMGSVAGANTLSGIDYILTNKFSSNLITALKKYAVWRYFTGTRADAYHFSEASSWPTSTLLRTHSTYPASGNQSPCAPSGPGGTNFVRFNPGSGGLSIIFDGQNSYTWAAYAIGYKNPVPSTEQEFILNSNNSDTVIMSWLGNSHIALIPVVTQWSSVANNLTHTYSASQVITEDVGVTAIEYPISTVDSTGSIIPRARVKNFGSDSVTFQVTFKIGGIYTSSRSKKLNAGVEDTVNFSTWLSPRGTYTTRCSTFVSGDANRSNDTMSGSVTVIVKDVGVTSITVPTGTIYRGILAPKATVKNYGTDSASFYSFFKIIDTLNTQVYLDSSYVNKLAPNKTSTRTFKEFFFQTGRYSLRCSTALSIDYNPLNNVKLDSVVVFFLPPWVLKDSVPVGPNSKAVKGGGALTAGIAGKIYGLKGNNTREFYIYDIDRDSWAMKESIPYDPLNKKKVNKGGALAYNKNSNPDIIYATKGNNTLEFWAYDVDNDSWIRKPDVPYNTIPVKKVKGGAGLTFLRRGGRDYIYLLKGNRTLEFYAFHCQGDSWIKSLTQAQPGPYYKSFKDGSCITTGLNNKLYALKGGARYNEFWCYDASFNTWTQLESLPRYDSLLNKSVKVKDGASLCFDGDSLIYAFKGGNRQSFWVYNINRNFWQEKDTIPKGTGGRKVSSGGALAYADDKVYALKGNRTLEFLRWTPYLSDIRPAQEKITAEISEKSERKFSVNSACSAVKFYVNSVVKSGDQISITPNPVTNHSHIKFNLAQPSKVNISLYNSVGQLLNIMSDREFEQGLHYLPLSLNGLTFGVYYLRCKVGQKINTIKIIIE